MSKIRAFALSLLLAVAAPFASAPAQHITIDDVSSQVSYSVGSGGQSTFTVPFPFFSNSDLKVYVGGTLKTLTTDYSVSGAGASAGGSITLVTAATSTTVKIARDVPVKRLSDYSPGSRLDINALNTDFDKLVAMTQQVRDRSLRVDVGEAGAVLDKTATRASRVIGFDALGTGLTTFNTASGVTTADNVTFLQAGTGAVARTIQDKGREIISAADFGVVADGTTNNSTALVSAITAATGKELVLDSGTTSVTIAAATTYVTPGANTVIRGRGKYATTLVFNIGSNAGFTIFNLANAGVTFRDLTIEVVATQGSYTAGGQALFGISANQPKFENVRFIGNTVEGVVIGGTATAADTVRLTFTSSALAGSPITVSYTVGAGNTTAQIATGLAAAVNANATLSAAGVVATATGSFVGIAQAATLIPQATFTGSVTGAATETVTAQSSTGQILWLAGSSADDFEANNTDVSGWNWVFLKANANTATNRRFSFNGGFYDQNVNGHLNLNSPSGTMDDVAIIRIRAGRVGVNSANALPFALAHVTNAKLIGNSCAGSPTYNQTVFHFEEASDGLSMLGNVCRFVTSTNYGAGFNGTGIFATDNNVGGGGYKPVKAAVVTGNVLWNTSTNTAGYGIWLSNVSVGSTLWNVQTNSFIGFSVDGLVPNTDSFNLYAGNFGAAYDGSSPYFSTATVPARALQLLGSTSGVLNLTAAAVSGTSAIKFPAGSTNFTATGPGFLKQASLGAAITVGSFAGSDFDAVFSSDGILTRTAAGTYTSRTITGTANEITVTNGNGVSGNPTLSLPAALTFTGKTVTGGAFSSPSLTTPTTDRLTVTGSTPPTAEGIYSPSASTLGVAVQGALALRVESVGVPGNYAVISASASGAMALYGSGASANIDWTMSTKGTSSNYILYGGSFGAVWFQIAGLASAVNYPKFLPAATGSPIELQATGTDGNIDIKNTPKGTGVVTSSTGFAATTTLKTGATTVGSLPTCNAGAKGTRYYVTDANATTFASTVAGGGANNVPVNCNGTNWIIGMNKPANDNAPAFTAIAA